MGGDFFFVIGIVLVLAALTLAFLGVRESDSFPPSRGVLAGVTVLFAAVVVSTMAFAVVKSRDEQKTRREKLASEETAAAAQSGQPPATPGGQPQASAGGNQQPPQPTAGGGSTIDISTPSSGALEFQPNGVQAKPGNVTIDYSNPSPVPHSIAVATANGNVLGQVQPFTNGKQTLSLTNLAPGKYTFYCTVPGHREAGMEGSLTVLGG